MGSKRLASQERTRMRNLSVNDSEGLYSGITTRVLADKLHRESIPTSVDIGEYIQSNKNTDIPRSRLSSIQERTQGSSRFLQGTAVPNSIIQNLNREKGYETDERAEYTSSSVEILDKILRRLSSRKIEMEKQVKQINQKYSDPNAMTSFENMQDVSSFNESWDILKEKRKTNKSGVAAYRSTFEDIRQSIDDAKRIQQIASDTIKSEETFENKELLAATSSKKIPKTVSDSQNLKTIFENNATADGMADASSAVLPTLNSVKDIKLNQTTAESNTSIPPSQSADVTSELKSDTKSKKAKRKLSKSRKASTASGSKSIDLKPTELSKEKSVKNKSADSSLGKKMPKPAKKISKTKKLEKTTPLETKITTKIKTTKTRNSRNIPIIVPP